jgi:hypothetical protein
MVRPPEPPVTWRYVEGSAVVAEGPVWLVGVIVEHPGAGVDVYVEDGPRIGSPRVMRLRVLGSSNPTLTVFPPQPLYLHAGLTLNDGGVGATWTVAWIPAA